MKKAQATLIGIGGILIGFMLVVNQLWAREMPPMSLPFGNNEGDALISPVGISSPSPTPSPVVQVINQPQRLVIESLEVDSQIELVGLAKDGRMDVPKADENVAWYQLGAKPGEIGSAVIAGHFDSRTGGPAVFFDLGNLEAGDEITVLGQNGQSLVFVVNEVALFTDANFPVTKVFNQTDTRRLNLITCAGTFNQQQKNYSDRLVVFTQLKSEPPEISI
jgi:sortase (surface protein transpeptidase)